MSVQGHTHFWFVRGSAPRHTSATFPGSIFAKKNGQGANMIAFGCSAGLHDIVFGPVGLPMGDEGMRCGRKA